MEEIWKDIEEFEGYYQVSNYGRVRSLDREYTVSTSYRQKEYTLPFKGKVLSPSKKNSGYLRVVLYKSRRRIIRYRDVHRLVAQMFKENPHNYGDVNHKDGNKVNNCAENLEWVDRQQNIKHAYHMELCKSGEDHPQAKLSDEDIRYIRENFKRYDKVNGIKPLSEKFGVTYQYISEIVNGHKRTKM